MIILQNLQISGSFDWIAKFVHPQKGKRTPSPENPNKLG